MQKFTKIEVSWMAVEFEKMAKEHEQQSKETSDREFAKMHQLRSEQYTDISRRLRLALKEGDKRIEIK
ncbi:hypothetical protein D3Z52_12985 [Clostridiaceae bacterium]|jgi:hypothetical protein|nr:hypothetical protein [Clostridiaceae bacterium]